MSETLLIRKHRTLLSIHENSVPLQNFLIDVHVQ